MPNTRIILIAFFTAILAVGGIQAEAVAKEAETNTPIYNPHTKSYLQLVRIGTGHSIRGRKIAAIGWRNAAQYARSRQYKGANGRLTVIKDRATHEFIEQKIKPPRETWIGLRYFCGMRKLLWVTGEVHPLNEYKVWAPNWRRSKYVCNGRRQYAPVYYTRTSNGLRWQASGFNKEFHYLLIEYLTQAK